MPSIRQSATTPQPVNQDLLLPDLFPELPPSIMKRFGSEAEEYQESIATFWTRTRRVLSDTYFQLAAPVNSLKATDPANLRKEFVAADATLAASIQTQIDVLVSADEAMVTRTETLEAQVQTPTTGLLARMTSEETVRATADSALASSITALTATVSTNLSDVNASIASEASARASADGAISSTVTALTATVASNLSTVNASIASESSARASADSALASSISSLSATVSSNNSTLSAAISSEASARATADAALTTYIDDQIASVAGFDASAIEARLTTIEMTYATQTFAKAKKTEAITAANSHSDAAVTAEATARATEDASISSTLASLSATVSSNNSTLTSAISSEATARASGDSAISSTVSSLSSTVSSNNTTLTASIASEASARAAADGHLASKYTLKVAAGNVVTGMNFTSSTNGGTDVSEIIFQTDVLKVKTASGSPITLMDIGANGIIFGTDLASNNFVAGTAGWKLTRSTGLLEARAGVIGGFDINASKLSASGITMDAASKILAVDGSGFTSRMSVVGGTPMFELLSGASTRVRIAWDNGLSSGSLAMLNSGGSPVTTVTEFGFTGSGSGITSLNASNISSGTLSNARLPSAISVTSVAASSGFSVGGNQVVGSRQATVADAGTAYNTSMTTGDFSGSDTVSLSNLVNHLNAVDIALVNHGNTINAIIDRLQAHGLIS